MALFIFDLDGTLVGPVGRAFQENRPPNAPEEQVVLPNVTARLAELRRLGHALAIASNQGGVAFGYVTHQQAANRVMRGSLAAIPGGVEMWEMAHCHPGAPTTLKGEPNPYLGDPEFDGLPVRKPGAGMLVKIMRRLNAPPQYTTFVGDSEDDWRAAMAAGVTFVPADVFFARTDPRPSFRQPPLAGHIPAGSVLRLLDGEPEHYYVGGIITADAVVVMPDAVKVDL